MGSSSSEAPRICSGLSSADGLVVSRKGRRVRSLCAHNQRTSRANKNLAWSHQQQQANFQRIFGDLPG